MQKVGGESKKKAGLKKGGGVKVGGAKSKSQKVGTKIVGLIQVEKK